MNAKKTMIATSVLVFGLFASISTAVQAQEAKAGVPAQVKKPLQEGIANRQGRNDIPFTILKNFVFPAAENMHTVLLTPLG